MENIIVYLYKSMIQLQVNIGFSVGNFGFQ